MILIKQIQKMNPAEEVGPWLSAMFGGDTLEKSLKKAVDIFRNNNPTVPVTSVKYASIFNDEFATTVPAGETYLTDANKTTIMQSLHIFVNVDDTPLWTKEYPLDVLYELALTQFEQLAING